MKFKKTLRFLTVALTLALLGVLIPVVPALAASMGISPSSGPPGTQITITGSGVGATGTAVSITASWGGGTSALTTDALGDFIAYLLVPAGIPATIYTITATSVGGTATQYFTVTAGFTLSATTGYVGDQVTVSGSGFNAGSTVSFYWDSSATAFASLTATVSGTLSGTITIPATFRGNHTITASVLNVPTQYFTVGSKIVINPVSGGVGDTITVTGTGFAAGPVNSVSITVDASIVATTPSAVNTNANGGFSCTFAMPSVIRGSHTVQATDGGGYATAVFSIGQKISLSPASGGTGDNIIISGSGFSAGQTITFKLDGNALTVSPSTVTSDQTGAFSNVSFTVPTLTAGAHTVSATDTDGNVANATLTVIARITITPSSGTVGTQITLSGSGFAPSAPVSVYWDAGATPVTTTTASTTGTLSGVTFNAPAGAKGTHTVKVQDTSSNQATTPFTISPKITLNPASGGYNDVITITFTGFAASSTLTLSIVSGTTAYSVATTPSPLTTDASGGATATFPVPAVYNGNWTIQATDAASNSAQTTLAVKQKLVLDTATGAAGAQVTLTGTGFLSNRGISVKYDGKSVTTNPSAITSDANGSFAAILTVPATPAGSYDITASDGSNIATASFAAVVSATVSKTTNQANPGNVGMELTITATGFKANSTITVTFESTPVTVATVTSDASGSFTATFKVPAATAGSHTIHATDGTTTKDFSFFMDSTAPAAPTLSTPADKFRPSQPVAFGWNAVTDPSSVTYTLQISQDPAFGAGTLILEKTGLTNASYTMTELEKLKSANSKNPYYWRVRATDLAGNVGDWSTASTFVIGFIWPSWMIHVWYSLGIIVALILGLWLGRRMAYQSY